MDLLVFERFLNIHILEYHKDYKQKVDGWAEGTNGELNKTLGRYSWPNCLPGSQRSSHIDPRALQPLEQLHTHTTLLRPFLVL